jgi:methionyl-tRNA formyltransferase
LNIVILTNRDLASQLALAYLVNGLEQHQLSIFLSEGVGNSKYYVNALKELSQYEKMVMGNLALDFDQLAEKAGCQLQGFSDLDNRINSIEGIARVGDCCPDLIISVRFGLIIDEPIISIPPCGVINLHSGVLPEYRGVMATFRAMLNAEPLIGSTLHYIRDRGIDTGDIISIERIAVDPDCSYLLNVLRLYPQGCDQILRAVNAINHKQPLPGQPQQGQPSYYSFPNSEEIEQFCAFGYRLFDPFEEQLIKDLQL